MIEVKAAESKVADSPQETLEHICDHLCKIPVSPAYSQEDVDKICSECKVAKFFQNLHRVHEEVDKAYLEKCKEVTELKSKLRQQEEKDREKRN